MPALPPVQCGAPATTRNVPSAFGLKLTWTCWEPTTDAVTPWPPAVTAASEPKVCPDEPVWVLSTQVSASVPMLPEAAADGERPLHRLIAAVCVVFGFAPVTSTISSSLAAPTQALSVMPPPDSVSTPL